MVALRKALRVPETVVRERDPPAGFDNLLVPFAMLRVPPREMFILSGKLAGGQEKLHPGIVDLCRCDNAGTSSCACLRITPAPLESRSTPQGIRLPEIQPQALEQTDTTYMPERRIPEKLSPQLRRCPRIHRSYGGETTCPATEHILCRRIVGVSETTIEPRSKRRITRLPANLPQTVPPRLREECLPGSPEGCPSFRRRSGRPA